MGRNFIFIWLLTANLYRTAVWWVLKAGKVGSVIKFLINYVISPIRLVICLVNGERNQPEYAGGSGHCQLQLTKIRTASRLHQMHGLKSQEKLSINESKWSVVLAAAGLISSIFIWI